MKDRFTLCFKQMAYTIIGSALAALLKLFIYLFLILGINIHTIMKKIRSLSLLKFLQWQLK